MFEVGKIQTAQCPLGLAVKMLKSPDKLDQNPCLSPHSRGDSIEIVRIYNRKAAECFKILFSRISGVPDDFANRPIQALRFILQIRRFPVVSYLFGTSVPVADPQ